MAKTDQVLQGRMGNAVFYRVNGKTYVRSVPSTYRDARTAAQQSNRMRLVVAGRFYQRLQGTFLREVWRLAARHFSMNGCNLFMKMNLQVFNSRTLYDPSHLMMSHGTLPRLNHPAVTLLADNRVCLTWDYWRRREVAHADDRLCVVALFEGRMYSPVLFEGLTVNRRDYSVTLDLGEGWNRRAHLYCFFASPDGQAYSPSDYLSVEPKSVAA